MKDPILLKQKVFNYFLTILSIILIIGCLYRTIYDYILEQRSITITSTISSIEYSGISTKAVVLYEVDEVKYENRISLLGNSDISVNDKLIIKVDIYSPEIVINNEHLLITLPIFFVALILLLLSYKKTLKFVKSYQNKKNLKEKGIYIQATITEVFANSNAPQHNGLYPYRLRCNYQNPADNNLYVFESEDTYTNLGEIIQKYNNKIVVVFLENGHPNNYYVDLNSLLPKYDIIDPIAFMSGETPKKDDQTNNEENPDNTTDKEENNEKEESN